jgi:hypothetical protein
MGGEGEPVVLNPTRLSDRLAVVSTNGARNGHAEEEQTEPTDVRQAKLRARLLTPSQIREMKPPPAIVPGWLSKGDLAVIYGSPKAGKSLAAQELANCRGTDREWLGLPTVPGSSLYMAAEGVGGLGKRNVAWEEYNGVEIDGVHYLPGRMNLLDNLMVGDIADLALELGVDMVVVDTVARVMMGADENSAKDMGRLVDGLDYIREKTGALALGVHHSGKDDTKGMRGSTALLGAVDGVFVATQANKLLTVQAEYLRDFEPPPPIQARLVPVLNSVVLEPITAAAAANTPHPALVCLREIDDPAGVPTSIWLKASGMAERSFYRARKDLQTAGQVINIGSEKQPRYRPANP